GAGHERLVADGLCVGREDPAVVVGDAGRPHHLEIGLHDGVGRRAEHAELAPPAKNVSHDDSHRDLRSAFCYMIRATESACSMSDDRDRIIVVGAGPVGLTAALALSRRGLPVTLLAAEPELVMELRGSTFHPPTLDLLDEFAIVPKMIEVGLKAPTWQFRDRETGPVATFDLS